jgi:hypothetical protein
MLFLGKSAALRIFPDAVLFLWPARNRPVFKGFHFMIKTADGTFRRRIGSPVSPPTLQSAKRLEKRKIGIYTERGELFNLI